MRESLRHASETGGAGGVTHRRYRDLLDMPYERMLGTVVTVP